jgi:hypothetical protein
LWHGRRFLFSLANAGLITSLLENGACKNALFASHGAGAENWATNASLIETYKLNAIDPQAYPASTLAAIVTGHKQSRIEDRLPWDHPARSYVSKGFFPPRVAVRVLADKNRSIRLDDF